MLNPDLKLNQKLFDTGVEQKPFDTYAQGKPTRDGYGDGLVQLGGSNPNVVVLTADLSESTRCETFAQKWPERFFECGVAEQNMAAIAAGLAVSGKTVFISSYAVFSPGKNWETIRTTIIYNDANVKIAGHHSGIVTGPDGCTHQATEDIASVRAWPGVRVIVPCDYHEALKATVAVADRAGPDYLRFTRDKTPIITTVETPFEIGKVQTFWLPSADQRGLKTQTNADSISKNQRLDQRQSADAVIFATGHLLYQALLSAKQLEEQGIAVLVANVATIKPLDQKKIIELAKQTRAVVTVEDHQVTGGLGGAIAELLAKELPTKIEFIGLQDTFAESGKPAELIEKYGLDANAISAAVQKVITRKK